MKNKECFGWWVDCLALGKTDECTQEPACHSDWVKSGGRCGGYYDKEVEKNEKQ